MLASKDKLANTSELFTLSQVSTLTSICHLNAIICPFASKCYSVKWHAGPKRGANITAYSTEQISDCLKNVKQDFKKLALRRTLATFSSQSVQRKGLLTSTPRTERDVASLARYDVAGVSLPVSLERISCLVTLATLLAYIRPGPNVIKLFTAPIFRNERVFVPGKPFQPSVPF